MKLIPMTDFVLYVAENADNINQDYAGLMVKYANFLKQPLELWMFISCDEGNVLERPKEKEHWTSEGFGGYSIDLKQVEKYNKAKSRVLFEGFTVQDAEWTDDLILDIIDGVDNFPILSYDTIKKRVYDSDSSEEYIIYTIEQLMDYSSKIILTPTAIKQIGL